jgi:hypothetical protein
VGGRAVRKGAAPAILGIAAILLIAANLLVGGYLVFGPSSAKHGSDKPAKPPVPITLNAPDGFKRVTANSTYGVIKPTFTDAFTPTMSSDPHNDIIIVDAFSPIAQAGQSDAELQNGIRQTLQELGGTVSAISGTVVAGKRAELAKVSYPVNGTQVTQDTYFIYADIALVQIRCQVATMAQEIQRGCLQVVQNIHIKDPPR